MKIETVEEIKKFAEQPMPYKANKATWDGTKKVEELRRVQAALPEQIEISKSVAGFLVTHCVDGILRQVAADKAYQPGLSSIQFAASLFYGLMAGGLGFHNAGTAYIAYQNISNYHKAMANAMEPTTEKIMNSYRIEERLGNRYFLVHGTLQEGEVTYSVGTGAPIGGDITMGHVGLGDNLGKSHLADKLYDTAYLNPDSEGPGSGRAK